MKTRLNSSCLNVCINQSLAIFIIIIDTFITFMAYSFACQQFLLS